MSSVIFISEKNVRDAWLSALVQVLVKGDNIKTEYDKPEDLPSKDASVLIEVQNPTSNPIMRKNKIINIKSKYGNDYNIYGCIADTYLIGSIQSGYIEEIVQGVNDHYIHESGSSFPYSYHDRIFNYTPYSLEDAIHKSYSIGSVDRDFVKSHKKLQEAGLVYQDEKQKYIWKVNNGKSLNLEHALSEQIGCKEVPLEVLNLPHVNQIEYIIEKLKESPYSRRAQAITWRPLIDPYHFDPPCLQRIFMRVKDGKLLMQTTWRSRDLFRAWEANVNGMIHIQKMVANELGVKIGHYLDFSNSLHIYGVSIPEVKDMLIRMKNKDEKFPEKIKEFVEKIN
ncbi:MAG: hypothetical protein GF383_15630 [Candidatus Lokiarchaeota archaeon]|nr:hypothetical protein [Candidatus Lokiarchaeota archaeon]MBD3343006.1 hypothetical protein [Candidatus Lokiarchaeota archaeon]